jgi:2-alkyl-3-oxoalkanoate reductase
MRVFFAGASGAIGPPAVRELIERGHHVVAMTSSTAKAPLLADLGAEPVVADALDAAALTRAVRAARPDGVVNMLTRIPAKPSRPSQLRATNELRERGVRHLLDAAVAAGAQRFVSESFFGVYGFGPYERPRTEDDPIGQERNRGVQAIIDALASSEAQVRAASAEQRIEGVSLRFGGFHGPLAPSTQTMVELVRRRRLPVIGAHGAVMPMLELGDGARAVADALERAPAGRLYNVCDDEPVAMDD